MTQQALACGVPVIVAGDTEDKPAVAARVAAAGVGRDLRTGRPDETQILQAVDDVLGATEISEQLERLRAVYARQDALAAIEALALAAEPQGEAAANGSESA